MWYRVFDIKYDVDESDQVDFNAAKRAGDVPSELKIEIDDDEDPVEVLSDYVSEETGWAVKSCGFELLDPDGNPIHDERYDSDFDGSEEDDDN